MSQAHTPASSVMSLLIPRLLLLSAAVMAGVIGGLFLLNFGGLFGGSVLGALPGNHTNYAAFYFGVFGGYIGTPVGAALGIWATGSAWHWRGSFWAALAGAVLCAIAGLWIFGEKLSFYSMSPGLLLFALLSGSGALLGFDLSSLRKQRREAGAEEHKGANNTALSIDFLSCFFAAVVGGAIGGIALSQVGSWFGQALKSASYDGALYSMMVSGYIGTIVGTALGGRRRQQQLHRRGSFLAAVGGAALCAMGGLWLFGGEFFTTRSVLGSVSLLAPLCATGAVLGLWYPGLEQQDGKA